MAETHKITSGTLAKLAGVNRETLRYYERRGLLASPDRNTARYRIYDTVDLSRVKFIKEAKALGFTLSEIKDLLSIADGDIVSCREVRDIAESKLTYIDGQIRGLRRLRSELNRLVAKCKSEKKIDSCPLIDSLDKRTK